MMLTLRKTDSKIVQNSNQNPPNNSSLDQLGQQREKQSQNLDVIKMDEDNQQIPVELRSNALEHKTSRQHQKYSETFTEIQKRSKLPYTLKNTLRKRAQQSGNFRKKRQIEVMSPIALSILSKLKKQQKACGICLGVMKQRDIVNLSKCDHLYCKDCIRDYVTYKIKMFEQVSCPEEQCNSVMNTETEFYNNLAEQIKKQYVKIHNFYVTSKDPSLKLCPKQDCEGIIKIVENQPKVCGTCKRQFCPKCYMDRHEGNCDQKQIDFLQNNLHFRQCQNCKFIVERTEGCNHMTCRCKHEFCYICGKKWTGYDHACNQNQQNIPNVGLFQQGGCCECCNCVNPICGDVCMSILKFPVRLFLAIMLAIVIVLVGAQALLMIGFFLFAAIVAGIFGYSISFICNLCDQDQVFLALLFTILFPVAICVGLYKAMTEMFAQLAGDQLGEVWEVVRDGCTCIWT